MGLFKNKCAYCNEKIDKGEEVFRDVKDPAFVGTRKKSFCCSEHADKYEKDSKDCCSGGGGGCCG